MGGAFIHVRMYRKVTFVNNGMANYQTQLVSLPDFGTIKQ